MNTEFQPEENWLLKDAANEIKQLRQSNTFMSARLEMFDAMMLLFTSNPRSNVMTMGEDVVWKIEKYLEKQSNQQKQ